MSKVDGEVYIYFIKFSEGQIVTRLAVAAFCFILFWHGSKLVFPKSGNKTAAIE